MRDDVHKDKKDDIKLLLNARMLVDFRDFLLIDTAVDAASRVPFNRSAAGSFNRNRNRNRNRNKNRNRNRNRSRFSFASDANGSGQQILASWRERERLQMKKPEWLYLPVEPPPTPNVLLDQCMELLRKQARLRMPEEQFRQEEILRESELELSGYLRPLGIEDVEGFEETIVLFLMVLDICEEIGLRFKARFALPRPNQLEPRIRPFLANPPYEAYPSNHAFQSFSIAYIFSRILPEHPASSELFRSARRIAENREWAGIHYASDTQAGHDLARMFLPTLEFVCRRQMLAAQDEWL